MYATDLILAVLQCRVRALTMNSCLLYCGTRRPLTNLDASVPYQDHDLLTNPMQGVFGADQGVYFNCDWQTFMAMIRDLENRIANENGTDTTRAVYVSVKWSETMFL